MSNKTRDTDLAYVAGFFDGEGSLALYRVKCGKSHSISVRLSIASNDLAILLSIQDILGVGSIHAKKRDGNPNHKQAYMWYATGHYSILGVLYALEPYVMQKAERLGTVIEYLESRTAHPMSRLTNAEINLVEVSSGK